MRVVLADDHEIVRKGLRALFDSRPQWTICGEAQNGQEALDLVLNLQPDLVVLDISMPVMNGLQAAKKIRELSPATKIVMLSMHGSPAAAKEALHAGADVFLTKSEAGIDFIQTVDTLFDGAS